MKPEATVLDLSRQLFRDSIPAALFDRANELFLAEGIPSGDMYEMAALTSLLPMSLARFSKA